MQVGTSPEGFLLRFVVSLKRAAFVNSFMLNPEPRANPLSLARYTPGRTFRP